MNFKGHGMPQHVYRDLDQAELDRGYNAAAHVGDTRPYFDDYNARKRGGQGQPAVFAGCPIWRRGRRDAGYLSSQVLRGARAYLLPWRGYRSQDKYNFSFVAGPLVERARSLSSRITACVRGRPGHRGADPPQHCLGVSARPHHGRRSQCDHDLRPLRRRAYRRARAGTCWDDHGAPDDVIKAAISLSGIYDQEARRLSFLNQYLRLDQAQSLRIRACSARQDGGCLCDRRGGTRNGRVHPAIQGLRPGAPGQKL